MVPITQSPEIDYEVRFDIAHHVRVIIEYPALIDIDNLLARIAIMVLGEASELNLVADAFARQSYADHGKIMSEWWNNTSAEEKNHGLCTDIWQSLPASSEAVVYSR